MHGGSTPSARRLPLTRALLQALDRGLHGLVGFDTLDDQPRRACRGLGACGTGSSLRRRRRGVPHNHVGVAVGCGWGGCLGRKLRGGCGHGHLKVTRQTSAATRGACTCPPSDDRKLVAVSASQTPFGGRAYIPEHESQKQERRPARLRLAAFPHDHFAETPAALGQLLVQSFEPLGSEDVRSRDEAFISRSRCG